MDRRQFLHANGLLATGLAVGAAPAPARAADSSPLKFRLGMVTYNVAAKWDLPTLLRMCKLIGISPVELRTTHKHGVEPTLSKAQRQEVRQRFADAGIQIWGCGSVCEFHSPDPAEVRQQIETCKRFVELAADIGGKGVKVRPNDLPKNVPVQKTLEQIGTSLIECGKAAADAGIEIWVEVHGRGTAEPAHMRTIMEHCGHPKVGVTWNSNPTDVRNGSVEDSFRLLQPWIRSCHINDLYKDLAGAYPYRQLFQLMRQSGYDRVTMIEVAGMPDLPSSEVFLRYYKALWTELARPQ